ncbi:hypothetical protein [Pedobacter sp. HDW13]|uniref:hypothetical protein n=1 Tax=Pedobacter sp. HDW13 TaxID=2714940 RepID=UPI001F10F6B8|nr:hypothetical protein [Pedobacter sp. HDW13]
MRKKICLFGLGCLLIAGLPEKTFASRSTNANYNHFAAEPTALIGRWDITVDQNGKPAPAWLEVKLSGYKTLVGYFVSTAGSARPVSEVKFDGKTFRFEIPPQWESGTANLVMEGELTDAGIQGAMTECNGTKYSWKGVKAPYLKRAAAPAWARL